MTYWTSSNGRIELNIPIELASFGYHSGACDSDIAELMGLDSIKSQLSAISPNVLIDELRNYGAWDDIELSKHQDNLARILWLACGDLVDGEDL